MNRKENAVICKHSGLNCCQAVLAAYKDITGMSDEEVKKLGAAFGSGMGGMEGTCGALCGAEMVLGLTKYTGAPVMKQARDIHAEFKACCGATICKDLKQIINGAPLCSCDDCVRNAAAILEEKILG